MGDVFVYWDNSNIFHEAQRIAEERSGTPGARNLVRSHFDNLLRLAKADRTLRSAFAAGSIPPEMRSLWNRMENLGVEVMWFDRGNRARREQEVPDNGLQLRMMENALRYPSTPGIAVVLTGDGAGYSDGHGLHTTLELLHDRGWASRCCPGGIPANGRCVNGQKQMESSFRWTTTTTPSPSVSRHDLDTRLPRPAMPSNLI